MRRTPIRRQLELTDEGSSSASSRDSGSYTQAPAQHTLQQLRQPTTIPPPSAASQLRTASHPTPAVQRSNARSKHATPFAAPAQSPAMTQQQQGQHSQQQRRKEQEQLAMALNLSTMGSADADACLAASLASARNSAEHNPSSLASPRDYSDSWLEATNTFPATSPAPTTAGWSAVGKRANDASDTTAWRKPAPAPTTFSNPTPAYAYSPAGAVRVDSAPKRASLELARKTGSPTGAPSIGKGPGQQSGTASVSIGLNRALPAEGGSAGSSRGGSRGGSSGQVDASLPSYPALPVANTPDTAEARSNPCVTSLQGKKSSNPRKAAASKQKAGSIRVLNAATPTSTSQLSYHNLAAARLSGTSNNGNGSVRASGSLGSSGGGALAANLSSSSLFQRGSSFGSSGGGPGSASDCDFLPPVTALDLAWDLKMSGLTQSRQEVLSDEILDAQDEVHKGAVLWLMAGQQQDRGPSDDAGGSGQVLARGTSLEAMLDMMGKASGKDVQMTAAELAAAAKRFFTSVIASKDWDLQVTALVKHGWERVTDTKGPHLKYRREFLDGGTQTLIHACSPSDSQRGVKNFQLLHMLAAVPAVIAAASFCLRISPRRRPSAKDQRGAIRAPCAAPTTEHHRLPGLESPAGPPAAGPPPVHQPRFVRRDSSRPGLCEPWKLCVRQNPLWCNGRQSSEASQLKKLDLVAHERNAAYCQRLSPGGGLHSRGS
ncbi:MAG: hypothetical protein WDW36_001208 [Sanguina aurantia]